MVLGFSKNMQRIVIYRDVNKTPSSHNIAHSVLWDESFIDCDDIFISRLTACAIDILQTFDKMIFYGNVDNTCAISILSSNEDYGLEIDIETKNITAKSGNWETIQLPALPTKYENLALALQKSLIVKNIRKLVYPITRESLLSTLSDENELKLLRKRKISTKFGF